MQRKRRISGFTMAEMLIVLAIIAVLSGVTFIAVQNHQRSMALLERDSIAKEIFVAAQNHLTVAESQGYLSDEKTIFGENGTKIDGDESDIIFYVVNTNAKFDSDYNYILSQMLPFGAVDETVRLGGRYLIRYQANPARVLDVFYWTTDKRYGDATITYKDSDLLEFRNDRNKRKDNTPIIGWYGGENSLEPGLALTPPSLVVKNAERLTVEVTLPEDFNAVAENKVKLIISSEKGGSGAKASIDLLDTGNARIIPPASGSTSSVYTVILDDITTAFSGSDGLHFADLNNYATAEGESAIVFMKGEGGSTAPTFFPGENIIIQAVVYNNTQLTNIAYSSEVTTNSLFADIESIVDDEGAATGKNTAMIGNFRHLENLDAVISRLDASAGIAKASQVDDLVWIKSGDDTAFIKDGETVSIYPCGGAADKGTSNDCYYPVTPSTMTGDESVASPAALPIAYEGNYHSITGVKVDGKGDAGLFGAVTVKVAAAEDDEEEEEDEDAPVTLKPGIANLKLIDFDIKTASGNAGALAGTLTTASDAAKGTAVTNVVAYNTDSATAADITAVSGMAGGLIGSMTGSTVEGCAAALTVSGATCAGGLVGKAEDGAITASYAGGHTVGGRYAGVTDPESDDAGTGFNVTAAGVAGGLVGESTADVSNSYSTCSVAGKATTATVGGLVGSAGGGSFTDCYATGLVYGKAAEDADGNVTTATTGAFAGSLGTGATATDCHYYEIINERLDDAEHPYLTALGGNGANEGITPFDSDAATYDAFVGAPTAWNGAEPYDVTVTTPTPRTGLDTYYQVGGESKYPLMGADQLGADTKTATDAEAAKTRFVATHYGDWPAPETFVINTQTTTTAP